MITNRLKTVFALATAIAWLVPSCAAQDEPPAFDTVARDVQQNLQQSLAELAALRERIAGEKLPLTQQLRDLETELLAARSQFQTATRTLDGRTLELGNLRADLQQRRDQSNYLSNLLGEYSRNFESRLHVADAQRYRKQLDAARLALDNTSITEEQLFDSLLSMVATSVGQLEDALGGTRFDGSAVADGVVKPGTFVMLGPAAVFRSADGTAIGSVEELPGSVEPAVIPFASQEAREAVAQLVLGVGGSFPIDTTLGNARKVESIKESLWEHVQKGGPVMVPIFTLAGIALLVVLLKWLSMSLIRRPSKRQVEELFDYLDSGSYAAAAEHAEELPGPVGDMLLAGARHLGEPRELVEEVMFERVLSARLRLNSWLPFVALCATAAPLLGLLGTVTGIMNTFSLMTQFGAGDPRTLSSGISEALVTTEFGLIIAIPSLLLHAFLSRKARSIVDQMEKAAIQFMNHVRSPIVIVEPETAGVA